MPLAFAMPVRICSADYYHRQGHKMIGDCKAILKKLMAAGESQSSVARATGVPQSTISLILSGNRPDPATSTTRKIEAYAAVRLKRKPRK